MRDEINRVYGAFKSIVDLNSEKIRDKEFVDFIKKNELNAECTDDKELLKLSVLSLHQEWEGLLSDEHINLNDTLGAECSVLIEKGIEFFNISPYELKLLREEVVYGDKKYSVIINDTKELLKYYNKNTNEPNDFRCRYLILNYLLLHDVENVRFYIEELKYFKENVLYDFEVPIHIARLYDEVLYYDDDLYDEKELQYALDLFEQTYEVNKRLNIFDPVIFTIYYIKTISCYLSYLDKYEHSNTNKYTKFHDQPKYLTSQNDLFKPRFLFLNSFDEDLVFNVDAKTIALIEKHDDLILSILPYYDYAANDHNISPIFKGTDTLIWKHSLNNSLSGRLDCSFYYSDLRTPIIDTPLDIKPEQLKEMLLKEFKSEHEIKEINELFDEYYKETDDNNVDEDIEYDEFEEDIQIPDFYDEGYSLKTDDLVESMSSPDWKEVSFDPSIYPLRGFAFTIANDLKEILNDKSQSVELRGASCKAISLIDYEYSDVLLVKALRDHEDEVKEAALEGLINLKKPIAQDCFEVINNFSNKEIANPVILSKIQGAIKSGLIKKAI